MQMHLKNLLELINPLLVLMSIQYNLVRNYLHLEVVVCYFHYIHSFVPIKEIYSYVVYKHVLDIISSILCYKKIKTN